MNDLGDINITGTTERIGDINLGVNDAELLPDMELGN